jgi:hypothetical protein
MSVAPSHLPNIGSPSMDAPSKTKAIARKYPPNSIRLREHAIDSLPIEDEGRLVPRDRAGCMVEIRDMAQNDSRHTSRGKQHETQKTQGASEECGCLAASKEEHDQQHDRCKV